MWVGSGWAAVVMIQTVVLVSGLMKQRYRWNVGDPGRITTRYYEDMRSGNNIVGD